MSKLDKVGKLIFVHGASSSGKTTVTRELQKITEEPFWHYSIDHFRDSGILPIERYNNNEFKWGNYRDAFFEGYHYSISAFIKAGNNLILEHIIETNEWRKLLQKLFESMDVYFVGIHCNLDELEKRERERGNRRIGDAKKDFETIHQGLVYDLELDGTQNPEENALTLLSEWRNRSKLSSFFKNV